MSTIDAIRARAAARKRKQAMAAPQQPEAGFVEQSMSGVNEGIGGMLGFPVDAVTDAINATGQLFGREEPLIQNPVGGSQWLNEGPLSPTISDTQPQTRAQRYGRRIGQEVGASAAMAPLAMGSAAVRGAPWLFAGTEAASALGSGTGAAIANDFFPDSATAEIIGALAGGVGAGSLTAKAFGSGGREAITRGGIEDQRMRADEAYAPVRADQRTLPSDYVDDMATSILAKAEADRINPRLHPGSSAVLDAIIEESGKPMRIEDVENLRRLTQQGLPATASPADRRLATQMTGQITDYLDNLADPVADSLVDGRNAHRRALAAQSIEDASTKAARRAASTGSGGNEINAMRQNLRRILDNPRLSRSFTKAELEMMDQVVKGTAGQNTLRRLSRFAPTSGGLSAMLGIGGAMASPAVALPLMAGTEIAKFAGEKSTRGAVDALMKSIAPDRILQTGEAGITPVIRALLAARTTAGAR